MPIKSSGGGVRRGERREREGGERERDTEREKGKVNGREKGTERAMEDRFTARQKRGEERRGKQCHSLSLFQQSLESSLDPTQSLMHSLQKVSSKGFF